MLAGAKRENGDLISALLRFRAKREERDIAMNGLI
jgi:hypothetical protein